MLAAPAGVVHRTKLLPGRHMGSLQLTGISTVVLTRALAATGSQRSTGPDWAAAEGEPTQHATADRTAALAQSRRCPTAWMRSVQPPSADMPSSSPWIVQAPAPTP